MSGIKKAFLPIVEALRAAMEADPKVKVASILGDIEALASAKSGAGGGKATTFHRDEAGNVVAVKCYYHGLWMDPRVAEFGEKKSSASGLNSMSKDGMSKWTKQNAAAKKAKEDLLLKVQSGEVPADQIADALVAIDAERETVIPREDGYGFATLEEVIADSQARGL
jgi:hypothetical protein